MVIPPILSSPLYLQSSDSSLSLFNKRKKERRNLKLQKVHQTSSVTRVFIGFSFNPMLSGERRSGEMQEGLRGLLGLSLNWHGLYKPYPMKKYSIGISIACGCSSVTIDPQAWTCQNNPSILSHSSLTQINVNLFAPRTSTKALNLLSSFEVMWTASE